ncbi:DUF2345 domain-containing protein [Burkholderia thailandensis]|nr:DUF2345 domain-containing protein [Burkholderia thailandensis]
MTGQAAVCVWGTACVGSVGGKVRGFGEDGIKQCGEGDVGIESHGETLDVIGQKTVRLVSATERIEIGADKEILMK